MLAKLRPRLTYANVIATTALFIALGGSSYAALQITGADVRNNSLTGRDIKNLTGADVKNNKLTGRDIRGLKGGDIANKSLGVEEFKDGELLVGAKGSPGVPGPQGLQGPVGPVGPRGSAVAYARVAADGAVDAAHSLNIAQANVVQANNGLYCFHSLGFEPKSVSVTVDGDGLAGNDEVLAHAKLTTLAGNTCGAAITTQAFVHLFKAGGVGNFNAPFYIVLN